MRGGLRTYNALDHAGAEFLRRLRDLLFRRIGDEGGNRRAGARNERAEAADDRAAEHGGNGSLEVGLARPHVAQAHLGVLGVDRLDLIDAVHELGDAEQAERQRHQLDAVRELREPEGETLGAGLDVLADHAEQQSQHRHRHALERRAARQRRACQQAEQHQRADLGRPELQRHPHQDG